MSDNIAFENWLHDNGDEPVYEGSDEMLHLFASSVRSMLLEAFEAGEENASCCGR